MIEILAREIIHGKFIAFWSGGFGGGGEGGVEVAMLRDCL